MGHKILVDGTAYEITGGRTLIDGTGYDIKKGRTLIDGTGYDILFTPPPLIVYDGGSELVNGTEASKSSNVSITSGTIRLYFSTSKTAHYSISGIDFTKYNTLNFTGKVNNQYAITTRKVGYSSSPSTTAFTASENLTSTESTHSVDISNVEGTRYYIKLYGSVASTGSSLFMTVSKIWLE